MKSVIAYAVTLPRALHAVTARIPAIREGIEFAYPVYRGIRAARRAARRWGNGAQVAKVEVRELHRYDYRFRAKETR
jgi:hypothetical protein